MSTEFTANRAGGSTINFANPTYETFRPGTTFRALSYINRWAGNLKRDYCVLQHSMLVAEIIEEPELKIYGLLHDVPEEGTGDVSGPYKAFIDRMTNGFVLQHENELFAKVCLAAGIKIPNERIRKIVDRADMIARATELRDVVENPDGIKLRYDPWPKIIPAIPREQLIAQALNCYYTYHAINSPQQATANA